MTRNGLGVSVGMALAVASMGCDAAQDPNAPSTASVTSSAQALSLADRVVQTVKQTNLVSNQSGVASHVDTDLQNAWGLAFGATGPAWVSAAETGLSQVYDGSGALKLSVAIPGVSSEQPGAPTGQVFNGDAAAFMGDRFIFASEDGGISAWQPTAGTSAVLRADGADHGAVYKGIAIAETEDGPRLYATDFHNGTIDVWDRNYDKVTTPAHFVDPFLPEGYAPFNVMAHGEHLLVTFAKQELPDAEDDDPGPGRGFVDVFGTDGRFVQRLISRGALNSPWGMAMEAAPAGKLGTRLLVGNFGDGKVHVYRLISLGKFHLAFLEGALGDTEHRPLVIDGLWALSFGSGGAGFDGNALYFTAGPNDEEDGLFGQLDFQ